MFPGGGLHLGEKVLQILRLSNDFGHDLANYCKTVFFLNHKLRVIVR